MNCVFAGGLTLMFALSPAAAQSSADGRAVMERTCGQCHSLSQVTTQHKTVEQWSDTVTRMIGNGAQLSDAEYQAVVEYLAMQLGPAKQKEQP